MVPACVIQLANQYANKFPNDIEEAAKQLSRSVRSREDFAQLVDPLLESGFLRLIHEARGRRNLKIVSCLNSAEPVDEKSTKAPYLGGPKVNYMKSTIVKDAYRSILEKTIAGRSIGDMTLSDVAKAREGEMALANGHEANARFLMWVESQKIAPGQKVRDVVDPRKADKVWKRIEKQSKAAVAA